jgi:hypothetical protein
MRELGATVARVLIIAIFAIAVPRPVSAEERYEVFLACGVQPIERVEIAITLPTPILPIEANFGAGCSDQDCTNAQLLGSSVNPELSFVVGPWNSTGGRADALYFALQGNGHTPQGVSPDARLCDPNTSEHVASILVAAFPPVGSTPAFTTERLDEITPTNINAGTFHHVAFTAIGGIELPFDQFMYVVGPDQTIIDVGISPDQSDPSGRTWSLSLDADLEIHKLTIGVVAPAGSGPEDIQLIGCPNNADIPGAISCTGAEGDFISQVNSRTAGPDATPPAGVRSDAMYATLEGSRAGINYPVRSLNVPYYTSTLGRVFVATGQPYVAPELTFDGAAAVMGSSSHFVRADLIPEPDPIPPLGGEAIEDSDGDGLVNNTDNCLYVSNPDQLDSDQDGRGDACVPDVDGDDCWDWMDNCSAVANHDQRDTNDDGYGNACDADYDNDGVTAAPDLTALKAAYFTQVGDANYDPNIDHNGDGAINAIDLAVFKANYLHPVGPSSLGCAGASPCASLAWMCEP